MSVVGLKGSAPTPSTTSSPAAVTFFVQALADLGRDGFGLVAGQAHDDGAVGGVTATGRPQRAVELDGQAGDGPSALSMVMIVRARHDGDDIGQRTGEGAPGPHGSDRMG